MTYTIETKAETLKKRALRRTEMKVLRFITEYMRREHIRNEEIRQDYQTL